MKRFAQVVRVKPEKYEEYRRLHAAVWPDVLKMITACNIRNYSIYHYNGMLFAYFEYAGEEFEADMAKMAADPTTRKWWSVCMPCHDPVPDRKEGEWWHTIEEIFHWD